MKQHHPLRGRPVVHARSAGYALSIIVPCVGTLSAMMPGCGGKLGVVPEAAGGAVSSDAGESGERGGSGGAQPGRGMQETGGIPGAGRPGTGAPGGGLGASGEGAGGDMQLCASAADCMDGEVCCAVVGGSNGPPTLQTECSSSCDAGSGTIQVCSSGDECAAGESCEPGPFGVNVCGEQNAAGAGGRVGSGGRMGFGGQPGASGLTGSGGRMGVGGRSGRGGP